MWDIYIYISCKTSLQIPLWLHVAGHGGSKDAGPTDDPRREGAGPWLISWPFFTKWQCVKTNSTPVVHIKIAGIYGCKWM